ncbi:MAG: outer membrane beta-barrel protein [Candidatus Sulfotelmatobacter sp.]
MIGKFATASALTLLVLTMLVLTMPGSHAVAQTKTDGQAPATQAAGTSPTAQQPAAPAATPTPQQPAGAEEPGEVGPAVRQKRPKDYKNWVFNVGAGANTDSGKTYTWVRGGGGVATAGVARNANKYLGLHADFLIADLPLRQSTLELAQATGASSYVWAINLDPIINVPVTKLWGGYVLFGATYDHRAGSLNSDATIPGTPCNGFWVWWGACSSSADISLPLSGSFVNSSLNQFGYNIGAGLTRKMPSGAEIYVEYRLTHGTGNGLTTDFRPITIGVRW